MTNDSTPATATRSIWVSLRKITPRIALVRRNVRELERGLIETRLRGADILYDTDNDTALLRIRLDADQVSDTFVAELRRRAADIGASIIDVGRLEPDVRARFRDAYQRHYTVKFPGIATSGEALEVLARHLGALTDRAETVEELPDEPAVLTVRFRRGDGWQLGRVRSLSMASISIATGCPPRKGGVVEVELAVHDVAVRLPAIVLAVTPPETASILGAFGFGARFAVADERTRLRLRRIVAIVEADPSLTARPPQRRHVRYPVHLPVSVGLGGASTRLAALDISASGLFVACSERVRRGTPTGLALVLERGDESINAGARVTRTISGAAAASRNAPSGIGLEITSMSERDARRYRALIERIRRRAGQEICIGAAPDRATALVDALTAVGYAASAIADPAALLARAKARDAPDLLIIDESLPPGDPATERALSSRSRAHPLSLMSFGGPPAQVWELADAALDDRAPREI